ncbi:MAG: hypothetical protein H0T46_12360 [Deltaproteobacteria bacterium]|nr:hypothetical protein [Deltaproteobacteria bacterium]
MRTRVIGVAVLSCFVSSLSFAQPGTDGDDGTGAPPPPPPSGDPAPVMAPPPPPPPGPMPVEPVSTVDKGIVEDANAGRSWLAPTALTEPAGTWSFSDFELFLVSLHYSPTDQLSLSATTMLPIVEDQPFWLLASGKYQIIKSGNVRVALQGAVTHVAADGNGATAAILGGALTYCIDIDCHSTVTGYAAAGFAHEEQSAVPVVLSGALAYRINKHVKLLLEADTGYVAGEIDTFANGFLAWYGVRFTSKIIGVDLGFVKPICTGDEDCDIGLVMGIPFVSFTYRSLKD